MVESALRRVEGAIKDPPPPAAVDNLAGARQRPSRLLFPLSYAPKERGPTVQPQPPGREVFMLNYRILIVAAVAPVLVLLGLLVSLESTTRHKLVVPTVLLTEK